MSVSDKFENVVVYKKRSMLENNDKGFVRPLFSITSDGEIYHIDSSNYPSDIFVSNGYQTIDNTYAEGEPFLLDVHFKDEEKSSLDGINRYWTDGKYSKQLPPGVIVPVIKTKLPDQSSSRLPSGTTAPRNLFFILDDSAKKLFGIFMAIEDGQSGYFIEPRPSQALSYNASHSVAEFTLDDIEECILETEINGVYKSFISSVKQLSARSYTNYSYMSNSRLIAYANQLQIGKKNTFLSKREAEKLKQGISQFERTNIALKNNPHLERLKYVLEEYLGATDVGQEIITDFFESSKGKNFLQSYVAENESKLLSDQIQQIEQDAYKKRKEIDDKLQQLNAQFLKKQTELKNLSEEVTEARKSTELTIQLIEAEAEETRRERLKELDADLQSDIEALEAKRDQTTEELNEALHLLGLTADIDSLNTEVKVIHRDIDRKKAEKADLEKATKAVEDSLKNNDLASRVAELSVVSRVLKGGSANTEQDYRIFKPLEFASTKPSTAGDLIDQVRSHLDDEDGKSFSEVDMANLLLCTTQSFLTVLAGPPGVGKTSSVVKLAEALKIGDAQNNQNFLYMPVARGWVSGRDILGFYNSLNNTYQKARTGLYDFLSRPILNKEDSIKLVLLDEANLSPMEHYWSDFIGMCDREGRSRPIDTGRPEEDLRNLVVPRNVRFIATINNDSTTERLSPRLIDRVPVISLDQNFSENSGYSSGVKLEGAIDYDLFEEFFTDENPELSSALDKKLKDIINILSDRDPAYGTPISISHRKYTAIENYYSSAVKHDLMDSSSAFDFAISQHILPHIEGYGSKFRTRIIKLQTEIGASYPRSNKHLERILARGNDITGTYTFF
ncbi:AAA domain (dynein-related subfamily) [Marinobacterium sp. xm-g-59]|uniref:AAA family ATPase n=1 Tax=Marinobacterium sp. xm-g-59 TaxID=2497748 RepID=UPI001568DF7B|nr:AAA family ATPase [Marinobacterium sp. xm-g-59]NRP95860.1 AAA domain (dynein-related subfamily) [Marinobacterium sp. xm-g-59]